MNRLNEANEFYENMKSRKETTGAARKPPSTVDEDGDAKVPGLLSGNGEAKRNSGSSTTKDGIPSHVEKDVTLTPNG